jgi:cell division septation protein DedD
MRDFEEGAAGSPASVRRVGTILAVVVVAAVVVFSLGVMVGQRVTESVPTAAEPPPALPTETLVPPPAPAPKEASVKEKAPSRPAEKLTFFETLSGDKAAAPPALPKPSPPPPPPKAAAPSPEPAPSPKPATQKPSPPPPVKAASASSPGAQIKALMGSGPYHVQVSSTTNSAWAGDLVARMKKKGIKAVSTPVTIKGKKWYRIRVGSFPDRESAIQARQILKQKMKLDGMVVSG